MAGFTKLFSDIIDSTIWREDLPTKVVWVTMLAKADKHGIIRSSIPGLADAARVTLEQCQLALDKFFSPDPWSRTKDFEGRRIMETDGGWILLNYQKYRKIKDEDETRIATAERVRKHREKYDVTNVTHVTHVTQSNDIAEAEAEVVKDIPPTPPAPLPGKPPRKKRPSEEKHTFEPYPEQLTTAMAEWRGLRAFILSEEVQENLPIMERGTTRVVPVGSKSDALIEWNKWVGSITTDGVSVTHDDILSAVRAVIASRRNSVIRDNKASLCMLSTQLAKPIFKDALEAVIPKRVEAILA